MRRLCGESASQAHAGQGSRAQIFPNSDERAHTGSLPSKKVSLRLEKPCPERGSANGMPRSNNLSTENEKHSIFHGKKVFSC
jgi:hypothetical protein